jgi:hypothetical protein
MPPVRLEPTISADERPQTYSLDGAATGTGDKLYYVNQIYQPIRSSDIYLRGLSATTSVQTIDSKYKW